MIRTVLGDITQENLGITYCHEHIIMDLSPVRQENDSILSGQQVMVSELQLAKAQKVAAIIEVTNIGMGRNVVMLREIARQLAMHIVCSTGFYKEEYYPKVHLAKPVEQISELMVAEIQTGIDGTDIRAGIIAEIGSSYNSISPLEQKVFQAAARAQVQTGVAISTHCEMGTMALEQTELLLECGVKPSKIILGHMDLNTDLKIARRVLQQGVNIAFDTIGKNKYRSNENRVDDLVTLISDGYGEQIVLSQDVTRKSSLKRNGGNGYTYIFDYFIPALQAQGIEAEVIHKMLVQNPARILNIC